MKKLFKWLGIILISLIAIIAIIGFIANEPLPEGQASPEADAMAQKMLQAIDHPAWDTTTWTKWTFPGPHHYIWDKNRNFVQVEWEDINVVFHTKTKTGIATKNGTVLEGLEKDKLIENAWSFFCNDSFWFNAAAKAFDPGTERSIVKLEDGREGLMVRYTSGGVTPGDAYVWILDETGLPKSYKMWVNIIPIGGLEFTWEDWKTLHTGAKIAQFHKSKIMDLPIKDVNSADDWQGLGLDEDPFSAL